MIYLQSYVFLKDLSNSFHRWFNLANFHPGVSQLFGGVPRRHYLHLKTEEEFSSKSCSILFKIRDSNLLPSSHNCFSIVIILFTHPEQFKSLYSLVLQRPSFRVIHSQLPVIVLLILMVHRSNIL